MTRPIVDWALRYAGRGWPVFPLDPRGKRPLARLAPHGVKHATTDERVICEWWAREPKANIGIRCVPCLVIDVDLQHDGDATWARLLDGHPPIIGAPAVATPSGGWHAYFEPPGFAVVAGLGKGIDVQFGGKYVVAPPSIHPNGKAYRWVTPPSRGLASLPDWLAEELRAKPVADDLEGPAPVTPAPVARPRPRRPGERLPPLDVMERARRYLETAEVSVQGQKGSRTLMRVAATLRRGFELTEAESLTVIADWNGRCAPPWSAEELARALKRAATRPAVAGESGLPAIQRGALLAG